MKIILITVVLFLITSCEFVIDVEYPPVDSSGFMNQTDPLSNDSKSIMEGVYKVVEGNEYFGDNIVLKVSGEKLSAFTNKNIGYIIFQVGSLDSVIYCSGYWRYGAGTEAGLINFTISSSEGANNILAGD
ncbi:MAG: hypothetical protein R6W68_04290, partial [Ignavibacteriaceae bacterium]